MVTFGACGGPLRDGAGGIGLHNKLDSCRGIPIFVEDDQAVDAVLEPAFGQVKAIHRDPVWIPAQVMSIEPDEAARHPAEGDAQDRVGTGSSWWGDY